jgi:hypothetical protein
MYAIRDEREEKRERTRKEQSEGNERKNRGKVGNKLCDCFKYHFVHSAHMIYPPASVYLSLSLSLFTHATTSNISLSFSSP